MQGDSPTEETGTWGNTKKYNTNKGVFGIVLILVA